MDRALAAIAAVATALHLLAAPCAAAARPLVGRLPAAASTDEATTTTSALAPAAAHFHHRRAAAGDDDADAADATTEGKWLPFLGAHHLPAAYWAHKPVPWVGAGGDLGGAAAGAMEEGGEGEEVVRDRDRHRKRSSSYVGDGTMTSTRQEQLAMWASLLNPKGRGRSATAGWLPAPGIGEAADEEPAKASADTPVEGAEGDEQPSAGQSQTYWGNNGN